MKFDYAISVLRNKKRKHNYSLKYRNKYKSYGFSAYGKALNNEDKKNIIELEQAIKILKEKGVVIAEGELDNVKWESPYNKLVFYFKGLPKMIGIKIIKNRKVKIILEEQS